MSTDWYDEAVYRLEAQGAHIELSREFIGSVINLLYDAMEIRKPITKNHAAVEALVLLYSLRMDWDRCFSDAIELSQLHTRGGDIC